MGTFKIEGGIQLKGDVTPQGAKNEALQILCAVLLSPEKITIHNIPDIIDVNKLISLLGNLGVSVTIVTEISSNLYELRTTICLTTPTPTFSLYAGMLSSSKTALRYFTISDVIFGMI